MKRSKAFLMGWNACSTHVTRTRNPFKTMAPDDHDENVKMREDWDAGWNKRFYGEDINSEP